MTCSHGYFDNVDAAQPCGICVHLPGECDWGACHDPATRTVETLARGQGVVERRPMCGRHAALSTRACCQTERVTFRVRP